MMPRPYVSRRGMVQVNAFKSIFKQNLRLGHTKEESFVDAITATSDDKARKADPRLIEEYMKGNWKCRE